MSPKTHGLLDYLSGILLIISPWIFDFTAGGALQWIPVISGIIILCLALCTRYEAGLLKLIHLRTHLTLDVVMGLFLLASPWVFGFYSIMFWPHTIFGLWEVILGVFTKSIPSEGFRAGTRSSKT